MPLNPPLAFLKVVANHLDERIITLLRALAPDKHDPLSEL